MTEFVALRPKTYSYLINNGNSDAKAKGPKKYIKRIIKFNHYLCCLFSKKLILKLQQIYKSGAHDVYTIKINKIALSGNDGKRLQTIVNITTYPFRTNTLKLCKTELLNYLTKND